MRLRISGFASRFIIAMFTVLMLHLPSLTAASASEKWEGVDKVVVEKFANEHGRRARESIINTDQGDLLLFVFLVAGAVGGFAAGYYWRVLIERKPRDRD